MSRKRAVKDAEEAWASKLRSSASRTLCKVRKPENFPWATDSGRQILEAGLIQARDL